MTPSNKPNESWEDTNTPKETKKYNIYGLLKEGIQRQFGNPMDPALFDAQKKNKQKNKDDIRAHMWDIRRENMEEWSGIDDEAIKNIATDEAIVEQLLRMSQSLVFRRKRAYDRAIDLFPSIQWDDQKKLLLEISGYNEDELQNMLGRNTAIRKMVYGVLELRWVASSEQKEFDRIFHDKESYFDPKWLKRLGEIFDNYKKFNQPPDGDDIAFILSKYSTSALWDVRRKEILVALGVTLTIADAYKIGLIDDVFLERVSVEWFEEVYSQLSDTAKKSFVSWLSHNDSYVIPAVDFSENAMGKIFSDKKIVRKLSQEIFKSIAMDMPEKQSEKTDTVMEKIKQRKQAEAEKTGKEEADYNVYDEFIDDLKWLRKSDGITPNSIINRENLKKENAVLQFRHADGTTQYIRITKTQNETKNWPLDIDGNMTYGLKFDTLGIVNGQLQSPRGASVSYESFEQFLVAHDELVALTPDEFWELLTIDINEIGEWSTKIYDTPKIESEPVTVHTIASKLDMVDREGSKYGFEKGTAFVAPLQDEKTWKKHTEGGIWTIKKIHGDMVDIADPWGNISEKNIPIDSLYQLLKDNSLFKRIAKIPDDAHMVNELKSFDIDGLKDGKLFIKSKDDHGHHTEKTVTCFKGKNGDHIRMGEIKDGMVSFWAYDVDADMAAVKEYAKKNGLDKKVQWLYTWQSMSYAAFLKYLADEKLTASPKDLIVPDATHDLHGDWHGHHPHIHGSLMSRIFQMQNPASIWKGFEMIFHGIEHTLEKWAKLDAAKFALRTSSFLWLPDSVKAQVYADVVDGSKEIVEKYEKKIFGLPGPRGREKCLHIIENHDSRPEEVAAAMNYMLKNYGHLYAEDLKHKQSIVKDQDHWINAPNGTFMFFDAFVATANLGNLQHWRREAYKKAISNIGSVESHDAEPTEEELIHALFKELDGAWDKYPYAASVLKALGGPGWYENNWQNEGGAKAKEKWKKQTWGMSPQGRLNKAIGFLWSHEFLKWVGSMEAVMDKWKSPELQAFPFVWAVGGYARYVSQHNLQEIKWYAWKWYSFHAYSFIKSPEENDLYATVVRHALRAKWGDELVVKFDNIRKRLEFNPDNDKYTKKAALEMMELWQTHCDGTDGLHNMLQWHNGWLIKEAQTNKDIKAYTANLTSKHSEALSGVWISGDTMTDQYNEWGLRMNRIMAYDADTGLLSLQRTLDKMSLWRGGNRTGEMNNDDYSKLWWWVIEQMDTIKNLNFFQNDADLRKKQFDVYRKEIINFFAVKLNPGYQQLKSEEIENILKVPHKYWWDLKKMGIDPHAIFDRNAPDISPDDYNRWKDGSKYTGWSQHSPDDLIATVQGRASKTVNTWRRSQPIQDLTMQHPRHPGAPDPDLVSTGGAADPGYDGD